MAASKKEIADLHSALAKRCTTEVNDRESAPAWGNIANAFLKANAHMLEEVSVDALDDLKKAQSDRAARRGNRFKDNAKVIPLQAEG